MKHWIAENATVTGQVVLGDRVSIWYGAVLRGDSGEIRIGQGTNIQDLCVLHEKTRVGEFCTLGHGAIVHGCTLGDGCVVGMGSVILTGAELGDHCLVGAGAVVTSKTRAPAGSLLLGNPARIVRTLTEEEISRAFQNAEHYIRLAEEGLPETSTDR